MIRRETIGVNGGVVADDAGELGSVADAGETKPGSNQNMASAAMALLVAKPQLLAGNHITEF